MSTLMQVMQEIDQEFNIRDKSNFNDMLQAVNETSEKGIISQGTRAILLEGLSMFQVSIQDGGVVDAT